MSDHELSARSADVQAQALPTDPPALAGVPLGVLIVGAFGWLLSAIAIIVLPWPMPGAQPTIFAALLRRLIVTIPDEDALSALARHFVDLLPFAALVLIPICLVLAAGRRQSRGAVRALALIGLLGVLYSLSMALYVAGSCALIGFLVVLTSGVIGAESWTRARYDPSARVPMAEAQPDNQPDVQPNVQPDTLPEMLPTDADFSVFAGTSASADNLPEPSASAPSDSGTEDHDDLHSAS